MHLYFGLKCNDAVCHRNNKKKETAGSAAAFVGTCDITNVSLGEVHLSAQRSVLSIGTCGIIILSV